MMQYFQKKHVKPSVSINNVQREIEIKMEIKHLKKEQDKIFPKVKWYSSLFGLGIFSMNTRHMNSQTNRYHYEKFDSLSSRIYLLKLELEELDKNFPDAEKNKIFKK